MDRRGRSCDFNCCNKADEGRYRNEIEGIETVQLLIPSAEVRGSVYETAWDREDLVSQGFLSAIRAGRSELCF